MIRLFDGNTVFKNKSLVELKDTTRILFVDDEKTDLVKIIENEGWHVKYLKDIDKMSNSDLIDSHIICIDILGVCAGNIS